MDQIDEKQLFSKLFTDYHARFVRFAFSYVRDLSVAEDITSDAIIYYWENKQRLPDDANVPAYILTTIKNKCLNHLQHIRVKEKVGTQILNDAQWELDTRIATLKVLEPTELYTREIYDMVNRAMAKFPEKTQDIFRKSRFEHLSHKEIADISGLSVKTVEAYITTALKLLRSELGDYFLLLFFLWK